MEFQLIHFRDADKIIEEKAMVADVAMTMEYVFNTLPRLIVSRRTATNGP